MTATIGMVTIDCADPRDLATFWTAALDAKVVHDVDGDFLVLAPPADRGVMLGLQRVPEPKSGKNRTHLDLQTDDRVAEVRRLVDLGATVLAEHAHSGFRWSVMADPAGNEFCIGGQEA
jgi:catechol 2,3-dioxygenase-like lactoylglutathione lyase family enzyme